jgi:transcriptional regulator with XRE-family HTH domain
MQHIFQMRDTMPAEAFAAKTLGLQLQRKRGSMGVRAAAAEIGISPATLSRIENGRVPDLETLRKVCAWLGVDPAGYLGAPSSAPFRQHPAGLQVVFKKDRAPTPKTSQALGKLIIAAYNQFASQVKADGHQ